MVERNNTKNIENKVLGAVMIVDPDSTLHELIQESLRLRSISSRAFIDPSSALMDLEKCEQVTHPYLVVVESELGAMSGIEFMKAYRKLFPNSSVVFWFLSRRYDEDYVINALREGARDYIGKPFNLKIFIEKIYVLLRDFLC